MEVHREIVVDAPLDDVWQALTDADELAEWFANDVELELRPGARHGYLLEDPGASDAVIAFLRRHPLSDTIEIDNR